MLIACGTRRSIVEPVDPERDAAQDPPSFEPFDGSVPDSTWTGPMPPDGGDPPIVACGEDAGDGGECPLPESVCDGPDWLVYYSNGTCTDGGTCRWDKQFMLCPSSSGCVNGACHYMGTAPSH